VVSPNQTGLELFARGNDKGIYRKVITTSATGAWVKLSDLDGSIIDNRSDLDCSANSSTVHIVALGTNPAGALMHAYGAGTSYNAFFREISASTFDPSPSVTVVGSGSPNNWRLAGISAGYTQLGEVSSGTYTEFTGARPGPALISAPDLAYLAVSNANYTFLAAFDATNTLSLHRYVISPLPANYSTPGQLPAPTGTLYEYTPTICAAPYQGNYVVYLAAVAGGRLYASYLSNIADLSTFTSWVQVGTETVSSAPDCVITSDRVMHIVALNSSGATMLYEADPNTVSTWSAPKNLGTY